MCVCVCVCVYRYSLALFGLSIGRQSSPRPHAVLFNQPVSHSAQSLSQFVNQAVPLGATLGSVNGLSSSVLQLLSSTALQLWLIPPYKQLNPGVAAEIVCKFEILDARFYGATNMETWLAYGMSVGTVARSSSERGQ